MDHGPMAMTMASASSTTPSTLTPNAVVRPVSRTTSVTQPSRSCAPMIDGRLQHRLGEPRRVHLRRGRLCAELALHQRALAEPGRPGHGTTAATTASCACQHAPGVEPAIAPAAAVEVGGQLGVQVEAAPGEPTERGAVAPIQRQEAARLARGGAGDAGALDHDHLDLPQAEEVGGAGADHPAAADHHAHGSLRPPPIHFLRRTT